jgi:hypothetical protein
MFHQAYCQVDMAMSPKIAKNNINTNVKNYLT